MNNEILMIKSIFIFFSLWTVSMIMLWFRPRIEIFWKIAATLILAFYIWFFFNELTTGYEAFIADWYVSLLDFVKELVSIVFITMFIIWPFALVVVFYKANDMGAEKILKFLCLLTLVLWIIFIITYFFSQGIESFFYENLKKMIPHAG